MPLVEDIWFGAQVFILVLLVSFALLMLVRSHRSDLQSQKHFYLGFALYIVACLVAQSLYVVQNYLKMYQGFSSVYPRIIEIGGTGYEWLMIMCFAAGFIPLMFPIEKYMLQAHSLRILKLNIATCLLVVAPWVAAWFIEDRELATLLAYPGVALAALSAVISFGGSVVVYLRLGAKSTGSIRKKGFFIGIGLLLVYAGFIGGSNISAEYGLLVLTGPVMMVVGALLILRGFQIE